MKEHGSERKGFSRLISSATQLMETISRGMALYYQKTLGRDGNDNLERTLSQLFYEDLGIEELRRTGLDQHIASGLYARGKPVIAKRLSERPMDYDAPRLIDLLMMHFREAENQSREREIESGDYLLVPSPLAVTMDALTIPSEVQTKAYAILACRTLLSHRFNVWNSLSIDKDNNNGQALIDEARIVEEFRYIRTFIEHRDNVRNTNSIKQYVLNYLAAKGVLLLRLKKTEVVKFLLEGVFARKGRPSSDIAKVPEYRLSTRYKELPDPSNYVNELLGIPLPIRGADTIFFGALKTSSNKGLVIEVSGGPGSGKTSFALAVAASLAPIDTHTLYISFEEHVEDLVAKLKSQSQPKIQRLSFHHKNDFSWFNAYRCSDCDLESLEKNILSPLIERMVEVNEAKQKAVREEKIIAPLPLMVVIDSISALPLKSSELTANSLVCGSNCRDMSSSNTRRRLITLIDKCLELKAVVIVISSLSSELTGSLEYLVDMVISLGVEGQQEHNRKPTRLLTLSKSRHQIARHGTHIFHLSRESGFRIAPQLPSQIDVQHAYKQFLWEEQNVIKTLNVCMNRDTRKFSYIEFCDINMRSFILIHGRGSSGKAGLAMTLALAPRFRQGLYEREVVGRRVLVLSFLYPEAYYSELRRRIQGNMRQQWPALHEFGYAKDEAIGIGKEASKVDTLHFTPGFLNSEDLYSKFLRSLEKGRLEGRPYNVVIIDGLHNVALQFPGARDLDALWPIVYGTLSRSNITTITTFTTLEIRESQKTITEDTSRDSTFILKSHLPLMHALVQASDYVIELSRKEAGYKASLQSAINREPPRREITWDRNNLYILAEDNAEQPKNCETS